MIANPLFRQFTQIRKVYNPAWICFIAGERNKGRGQLGQLGDLYMKLEIDWTSICVPGLEPEGIDYISMRHLSVQTIQAKLVRG